MRKAIAVLIGILICSCIGLSYAQDLKVGYIDLDKVFQNYKKFGDAKEALETAAAEKESQREALVKEIKNMREKIDLLKDEEQQKKQNELEQKVQELQDFTYQASTSLREQEDEKLREITKEVKAVIEEYGKSNKYNIILDGMLIHYKDENLDITADITKTLNQRYKK